MLKIKNINNIKIKDFQWQGNEWVLYGIDTTSLEYRFIFIPMEAGRYDTHKAQLVLLDRNKKRLGNKVLGYKLWTTNGRFAYVNTNEILSWNALVGIVFRNIMVCN